VPVKAKPSAVPPVTQELCQNLLSLTEANQILNLSIPANTIVARSDGSGGDCNYHGGATYDPFLFFTTYNGPVPISNQDIHTTMTTIFGGATVTETTFTMVAGIGDQAAFLAGTFNPGDTNHRFAVFYVLYGKVVFECTNPENPTNVSDATLMSEVQQCAQLVVSRFPS
jgi:hypothetical protein